jgi:N-methylhydantoinase B
MIGRRQVTRHGAQAIQMTPGTFPTATTSRPFADAVTVEVVRYGLDAAAEQMARSIERSARSQVIREMLDYSTAVFDTDGGVIAQSTRVPIHLNSMTRALQTILRDYYPVEEWSPGDIFATNDPYSGGQHLPDIMTFSLVDASRPAAIVGTVGHHLDVGGRVAGSYGADATDIFQEGFRIRPCRVVEAGRRSQLFFDLLAANIRVPDKTLGDLQAQFASLELGRVEIQRILARYGVDTFAAAVEELVRHSEIRMRQMIETLPEGVFKASDWVDGDGIGDDPIPIAVAVWRKGSDLMVDFSDTGGQTRGPINCPLGATESAVYFTALSMLAPTLPSNHGCYKPIQVIAPSGSIVNPVSPAPVVGRAVVSHRIVNVLTAALSDALPDRAVAAYYGNSNVYVFSTTDNTGQTNVLFEIEVGGWGARADRDGHDCLSAGVHNLMNNPVELVEREFPARVISYSLRSDSGGAGRHRGGLGMRRVIEVLAPCEFSAQFDRVKFAPPGRSGGLAGKPARITVFAAGIETELPGKVLGYKLNPHDRVVIETQGGGGFGPPHEREPLAIERDIALGKVTEHADHGRPQASAFHD